MAGPRRVGARSLRILGVIAFMAVGLAVPSGAFAGDPCYHGFGMPPQSDEAATQINVAPCAFAPTVAHVAPGTTVTFFNGPEFVHLITGANQAWGSRDVEVAPGATVSYRFDTPGIYPYACALHRGMSGAIVVGDAAGSAADGGAPGGAAGAISDEPPAGDRGTSSTAGVGALLGGGALVALAGLIGLVIVRRRKASDTPAAPLESRLGTQ